MTYRLEPLTAEQASGWNDLIAPYESRELFHRREWLDYLAASCGADVRLWAICEGSQTKGYFCGGILRKGPFRILGSPLKGWGTNLMGPVTDGDIDQPSLLEAIDSAAAQEHLAMVELESRILSGPELSAADYRAVSGWTYLVALMPTQDSMWRALDSTRRTGVRKAIKSGLTVEDTDDPAIADEFYDQYSEVMARKGESPPYPRTSPQLLVRHLRKADLLFALRVRDGTGRVLATGLFPHDDRTLYFWGGASRADGLSLCPNDLLHWHAMCRAAELGLRRYDMSGHGRFKKKFGGVLTEITRWHKFYSQSARWARRGYELFWRTRVNLLGRWQRVALRRETGS